MDIEEKLLRAREEAVRFIDRVDEATTRLQSDRTLKITGCKETGAVKRSSMDLTRSLAVLRRSEWE